MVRWVEIALGLFCMLLLFAVLFNFIQIDGLRKENAGISAEVVELQSELAAAEGTITAQGGQISVLRSDLENAVAGAGVRIDLLSAQLAEAEERIGGLEGDFEAFEEEYVELQGNYEAQVEEYAQLMGQLEEFEESLEDKMYWYSENSDFGGENRNFLNSIDAKCIYGNEMNMPCVAAMLDDKGFRYLSEGSDYIKSLEEFEDAKGGDCEDWAMFVKAIINEMVKEEGVGELRILDTSRPGRTDIYEEGGVLYYYPYDSFEIGIDELNVACFPVSASEGHCALVSDGVLFEPQDGRRLGDVEWEGEDLLISGDGQVELLIGGTDIRVDEGDYWISYEYFIAKVRKALESG